MNPIRWIRKAYAHFWSSAIVKGVRILYQQGRYQEAAQAAEYAVHFARSRLGEEGFLHAVALDNLGQLKMFQGDYAAAESLFRRALEIVGPRLRPGYPHFATSLPLLRRVPEFLGWCCAVRPSFSVRFPMLSRVVESMGALYNPGYFIYGATLNNLGEVNRLRGDYPAAESYNREALEVFRSRFGEGHSQYLVALCNSALIHAAVARYATAKAVALRAVEIAGRRPGLGRRSDARIPSMLRAAAEGLGVRMDKNLIEYVYALNNLAEICREGGDYAEAERGYLEAWRVADNGLRAGHPARGTILGNLGLLLSSRGDEAAAESLLLEAREIARAALGEGHPDYALAVNNLACLYHSLGDDRLSEMGFRGVLEIRRAALGEGHPEFASSLVNLAALYESQGRYEEAEPLYLQALEIERAALGDGHPSCADTMGMLGSLYMSEGRYEEAEPLYLRAIEIDRAALGERHRGFAADLNNLASLRDAQGDVAAAESLYSRALEIKRAALGEDHPSYALGLNNLSSVRAAMGRIAESRELMERAASIEDRLIGQVFSMGSESQRAAYIRTIRVNLESFLSLVLQYESDSADAVRSALDLVLRRKAIAAEAAAGQRVAALGGKYPELIPGFQEIAELARRIAQKALAGPGPEGLEEHLYLLGYWSGRKDRLEAGLARRVPEMDLRQSFRASDRRAIALGLPEGVALIEFVRFSSCDFRAARVIGESPWKPDRYVAFVLVPGDPDAVQMIDLGEAGPIDRLIADFRSAIAEPPDDHLSRDMTRRPPTPDAVVEPGVGPALRAAVFDRLQPALGGRKRLLIAPDGDLSRLPFEVLPDAAGRLVADDGFAVDYVNCARDVLRFGAAPLGQPAEALVAADPDYDFGGTGTTTPEKPASSRGRRSRDLGQLRFPASRLPASRVEGERVADRLGVRPWLDSDVLEGRLRDECRSPWILHLATHGFFLNDQDESPPEATREVADPVAPGRPTGPILENPLLRAGLLLAGANTWHATRRLDGRAEDGLLTAEDVTGLDLLATELVVLSACQTGLGEVRTGEGVFGFQRAFVLAGARTLVMSLWAVHDLSTAILMDRFYENLLDRRLGRSESLRQAQSFVRDLTVGSIRDSWLTPEMIERLAAGDPATRDHLVQLALRSDAYRPFDDPYYWGAFICQGDPGPLRSNPPDARTSAPPP